MWQERLPSYPAIVVPPGRMQLCSGTLITGLSFILPASLLGALLRCHVGGFCVYLRSRQFFTAYLCQSLRCAVSQVGGSLLWWLGWGFARDTILSAAKRDQCTPLIPLSNCIIKSGSCSIVLISLIFAPFFCCTLFILPNSFCWQSLRCIRGQKPCHSQNVLVHANRCGSFIRQSQHPRRHCWPI